jgi:HK97 gp10 family phage protein
MAGKKVSFQFAGVAELKNTLNEVGLALDDREPAVKQIILGPAQKMRDNAKSLAPYRTGNLRDAVYASVGGVKQRGVIMGVRERKAPYAGFVEFGTSKMPAHPFFRPALLTMFSSYVADLAPGVQKLIEDTAAKNAYRPPG